MERDGTSCVVFVIVSGAEGAELGAIVGMVPVEGKMERCGGM